MRIESIPFSYFKIEETDQLGRFVRRTLSASHPEDPWIKELLKDLADPLAKTNIAIGSSRKQEHTKAIQTADSLLDRAFQGFVRVIAGYELSPIPAEAQAAGVLLPVLEQNDKRLYDRGYAEQASKYNSLFADMNQKEAVEALSTLGLTAWAGTLKSLLQSLETLRNDRTDAVATTEIPTDKAANAELQEAIKIVLSDMNTLIRRNKVQGLEATDKLIEARVHEITAKARARKTQKKSPSGNPNSQDPITE